MASSATCTSGLLTIPNELVRQLCSYLDPFDKNSLRLVRKQLTESIGPILKAELLSSQNGEGALESWSYHNNQRKPVLSGATRYIRHLQVSMTPFQSRLLRQNPHSCMNYTYPDVETVTFLAESWRLEGSPAEEEHHVVIEATESSHLRKVYYEVPPRSEDDDSYLDLPQHDPIHRMSDMHPFAGHIIQVSSSSRSPGDLPQPPAMASRYRGIIRIDVVKSRSPEHDDPLKALTDIASWLPNAPYFEIEMSVLKNFGLPTKIRDSDRRGSDRLDFDSAQDLIREHRVGTYWEYWVCWQVRPHTGRKFSLDWTDFHSRAD